MISLVFFGNERLATGVSTTAPTLKALIEAGYNVTAVVSNYEVGTSRNRRNLEIADIAKDAGIPLLLPSNPKEVTSQLSSYGATLGVLVAYGKMVPQSMIDIFPKGIVNIHPSALPLHRGPTPIESVMLDGSSETAVCLMQLVRGMDAGPIYAKEVVGLTGKESKQELADRLLEVGGNLLIKTLPMIIDSSCKPITQDDSKASYDLLISKKDGIINWEKPAQRLEREIRAFLEWPKSKALINNTEVIITKAHVARGNGQAGKLSVNDTQLTIYTGKDALVIDQLIPIGKSEILGSDFIRGYRAKL